ncbi:glycoside hydrolase family 113 [Chondromyces apiculatus]|uniref:glycoside hydrolase family 113 n=1 Tax=Chondromyces apiculatus TaxID=51 RepID=UPI003521DDA1
MPAALHPSTFAAPAFAAPAFAAPAFAAPASAAPASVALGSRRVTAPPSRAAAPASPHLLPGAESWAAARLGGIRGITLGPIESLRHAGRGYGTPASARALDEATALGATWVSLTPFGRVASLKGTGIDLVFEAPFQENRRAVLAAIAQAHARGMKVLLVPHLWVEDGEWRARIDPGDDAGWARWAASYRSFLLTWARVAAEGGAEMLSVGVELRSWVTTPRAESFLAIIEEVRRVYPGLLTYSANWDDVDHTLIFDSLDLVGINAFYPLAEREGASLDDLLAGGRRVATQVENVARAWGKPVVLTEIGYTTRRDPALRPWEWPDGMKDVVIDQRAQAEAYLGIIAPFLDARSCAGFFVWRYYADPEDVSQEAEWGFSPRGKLAELVLRDAFSARWAADGAWISGDAIGHHRAWTPGVLGWELPLEGW